METIRARFLLIFFTTLFGTVVTAQNTLNQLDSEGRRHGEWKGFFDSDSTKIKFEGSFEHGKEKGLFKFYEEELKHPVAELFFAPATDTVQVKYLSQNGKVISEGKMLHKKRVGNWKYYHKESEKPMTVETYKNGVLHGEKTIFYESGAVAEKAQYVNGELQGERLLFSEKGVILEQLNYENGELHGPAKFFNGKGELVSEGEYRRDKHYGVWKYYENGKLKEEKNYSSK